MNDLIKLFHEAFKNDQHAVRLMTMLLDIVAAFESLEREERVINPDHILWLALVDLPSNPFYRHVADRITPLIQQAIISLRVHRAHASGVPVERRALTDLAIHLSFLTSGAQTAMLYAPILHDALNEVPVAPLPQLDEPDETQF